MINYFLLITQSTNDQVDYTYSVTDNTINWLDAFQIFQFILVPVLFLAIILFILYKFYKLFKEISTSLKQLNENLKKEK